MKSCRIFEPPHVGCYINTRDVRQLMEFLGDSLDCPMPPFVDAIRSEEMAQET